LNQSVTGYKYWGQYPSLYNQRNHEGKKKPKTPNSDQKRIHNQIWKQASATALVDQEIS